MTPDEEIVSEHGLELPSTRRAVRLERRRSHQILGVAICLGLASVIVGIAVDRHQRSADQRLTADALQREDLREGWKTLGAAAELEAQSGAQPSASAAVAPPAPAANVVIVNVPGQSGSAQPMNAVQPEQAAAMAPGSAPAPSNANAASPSESMPSMTYVVPITGLGSATSPVQTTPNGVVPTYAPGQNNVNPGSSPNPALPNNGNAITPGAPGLPNGASNLPSGSFNLPSGSSNLPSGSLNLPSGSPNLPSGVP